MDIMHGPIDNEEPPLHPDAAPLRDTTCEEAAYTCLVSREFYPTSQTTLGRVG